MSVSVLLDPQTQNDNWSSLYMSSLNANNITVNNITVNNDEIIENLTINGDLSVAGNALIGPNNLHISNGVGLNGEILSTNGSGVTTWIREFQGNGIIYKPGSISSGNIYASWPEIVIAVNNTNECLIVYVDDSIVSPAMITSNLDCKGRVEFRPARQSISSTVKFEFMQDIQITDPSFSGIMIVGGNTNLNSNIVLSNSYLMFMVHGTLFQNTIGSLLPIINIPNGNGNVIGFDLGSNMSTNNAISLINVGIGSTLILAQYNMSVPLGNNIISSTDGTAQLILEYDSTGNSSLVNIGYTGSIVLNPVSKAISNSYNDSLSPALGSTNVQGAIDALKIRPLSGYTLSFGANLTVNNYAYYNGIASDAGTLGVNSPLTQCICPISGTVIAVSYNTTSGNNTTGLAVEINGVEQGFTISGTSGIQTGLNFSITAGQTVGFHWVNNTAPGQSNFVIYIQQ